MRFFQPSMAIGGASLPTHLLTDGVTAEGLPFLVASLGGLKFCAGDEVCGVIGRVTASKETPNGTADVLLEDGAQVDVDETAELR